MEFDLEEFTTMQLYKNRDMLSYPEYQRDDNIWSDKNRKYLIDSILRGFDIPKIYFHVTDNYGGYNDEFTYKINGLTTSTKNLQFILLK